MHTSAITSLRAAAIALDGVVSGGRIRCPAPGKDKTNRSLSVKFNPDGTFSVKDWTGGDWRVARDHVKAALGITDSRPLPPLNENRPHIDPDRLRKQKDALSIWSRSLPITGTLAQRYLQSRGLTYQGEALRYYRGGRAMVALITDALTGEPCGIHRTYLDGDGRKVERKMLGRAGGAVVRLSADEDVTTGLAIAEGIETALAAPFRPIWATLSANTMEHFPVLSGVEALTIFADNDASGTGQKAAQACAERWHAAGREVTVHLPTEQGADFASIMEAA